MSKMKIEHIINAMLVVMGCLAVYGFVVVFTYKDPYVMSAKYCYDEGDCFYIERRTRNNGCPLFVSPGWSAKGGILQEDTCVVRENT